MVTKNPRFQTKHLKPGILFLLMTDLTAEFAIGRCIATDDDEADERNDE